jgi:hypothetical protein
VVMRKAGRERLDRDMRPKFHDKYTKSKESVWCFRRRDDGNAKRLFAMILL